jgi:RNA polymerase sigma-70 factor (ECF subfamily)
LDESVSDEQLMLEAAGGDMDAFERLVRRHQRGALNTACRFLGNRALAEEVAQEAFLRVLAAAGRYRPTASFRTYLFNIIYRLCVDAYRKRRPERLEGLPAPADPAEGPLQEALRDERAALVRAAIETLAPRQRMALVLKHFEGLSYEEIARALECSPKAVDALLIRAKAKLKEKLEDAI